jgi:hypothetical protein
MVKRAQELRLQPLRKAPYLDLLSASLEKSVKKAVSREKVDALDPEWVNVWVREKGGGWASLNTEQRGAVTGVLLGLRAGKRASDLSRVCVKHVSVMPENENWVQVVFPRTKNHPEGECVIVDALEHELVNVLCPARALLRWVQERKDHRAADEDL